MDMAIIPKLIWYFVDIQEIIWYNLSIIKRDRVCYSEMKIKSCALIAETPMCFPWGFDEEDQNCAALKLLLLNRLSLMRANGISNFYIPLDAGFGLYGAETVASMKKEMSGVNLFCVIPYEEQAVKWSPELRNRYYDVLSQCDKPITVSIEQLKTCEVDAMLEAIDRADSVLALSAGKQYQDKNFTLAMRYAQHIGKEIYRITPPANSL